MNDKKWDAIYDTSEPTLRKNAAKELPARICNGDLVADKITGFSGIVVAMTQYLDGRVQACVQSRELDGTKPGPEHWFDEYRLRIQIPAEFYVDKRPEGIGFRI